MATFCLLLRTMNSMLSTPTHEIPLRAESGIVYILLAVVLATRE